MWHNAKVLRLDQRRGAPENLADWARGEAAPGRRHRCFHGDAGGEFATPPQGVEVQGQFRVQAWVLLDLGHFRPRISLAGGHQRPVCDWLERANADVVRTTSAAPADPLEKNRAGMTAAPLHPGQRNRLSAAGLRRRLTYPKPVLIPSWASKPWRGLESVWSPGTNVSW
jgi:hypothetical protein